MDTVKPGEDPRQQAFLKVGRIVNEFTSKLSKEDVEAMIVIIHTAQSEMQREPQEETKDGPTTAGQVLSESKKVQSIINNLYQLVVRFSREKHEIADKDAVKHEYLMQKIRMANDQIVLL